MTLLHQNQNLKATHNSVLNFRIGAELNHVEIVHTSMSCANNLLSEDCSCTLFKTPSLPYESTFCLGGLKNIAVQPPEKNYWRRNFFLREYSKQPAQHVVALSCCQWRGLAVSRRLQIVCDGFHSRLEPIALDTYTGWQLIRRTQVYFAVSFNYCWIFNSIQFENNLSYLSLNAIIMISWRKVFFEGANAPAPPFCHWPFIHLWYHNNKTITFLFVIVCYHQFTEQFQNKTNLRFTIRARLLGLKVWIFKLGWAAAA